MFIRYNPPKGKENIHAIPHVKMREKRLKNKKTGKIRIVHVVDTSLAPQDIKWLRPGWNNFPKATWDQAKSNPGIIKMIKDGWIEVLDEKIKVKEGKKTVTKIMGQDDEPVDLHPLSESRAIEIVKDTYDRDILQRWEDEESRHKVKRALAKQIKPLLNEKKSDDDESDE